MKILKQLKVTKYDQKTEKLLKLLNRNFSDLNCVFNQIHIFIQNGNGQLMLYNWKLFYARCIFYRVWMDINLN
jgi:hypothetical protein